MRPDNLRYRFQFSFAYSDRMQRNSLTEVNMVFNIQDYVQCVTMLVKQNSIKLSC